MTRAAISSALAVAITAAAIWYLVTPEVVEELRTVAGRASWWALGLATLTGAVVQWLRAWRFAIMTAGTLTFPGLPLVRIAFQLNLLNFLLPFRLGDLGYPVLMRRAYGQPLLRAAGVLLLARIFDLCSVGAVFAAMSAWLGLAGGASALLWAVGVALALAPVVAVVGARALAARLAALPVVTERLPAVLSAAKSARHAPRTELVAIGLSFAIWLVFGVLAMLAANAVAEVPPAVALLGASAGSIAFALPVNGAGGLGLSQAAWAAVVNQAGIAWTDAVVSALALYAVTLVGALLFGSLAILVPGGRREMHQT